MSDPIQIWVRNDKGRVWGPLMPATLELLFDQSLIPGRIQLSMNGRDFAYPGRLIEVRDCVPKELWGEQGPDPGFEAAPAIPTPPPILVPTLAPPVGPARSAVPIAGPGTSASQAQPPRSTAAPAPVAPITLQGLQLPASGNLLTHSGLRLYYLAASSDANGLLSLTLSDRTVQIHFRKGNPEFVDSTHPEDLLSTFLVKSQLANFDQLGKAEKDKARFGGELIGALFGLGILNPGTAFVQLSLRATSILVRGLFAEQGTFTWELKDLAPHKAMPLGNRWALVCEQGRKLAGPELRRRLEAALDLPVMKSGGQVAVADLRLTPQETRALSYFDGVRSLNQLLHDLPNEADHILRVAFLLKEFDSVAFAAVRVRAPETSAPPTANVAAAPRLPSPPGAPPTLAAAAPAHLAAARAPSPVSSPPPSLAPAPPRAAAPAAVPRAPAAKLAAAPVAPVDPLAEIEQLTALLQKMKTQNYFDLLGLKDNVDAGAVKVAYFKSARLYHPDTVPPGAPPALAKLKEEIFGRVGEANRTLSDDKLRAEYAEEVKSGNAGEKVDIAQILAAEEMFYKSTILVKARKFPEAVKMLDEAIAAADEAEYRAWRGYAKFFTFPDKALGHVEAMKDINACLKRNDKIAAVWYFQGHMAKLMGDIPNAKKNFNRCVQLNPEHLDAQRELRLMK